MSKLSSWHWYLLFVALFFPPYLPAKITFSSDVSVIHKNDSAGFSEALAANSGFLPKKQIMFSNCLSPCGDFTCARADYLEELLQANQNTLLGCLEKLKSGEQKLHDQIDVLAMRSGLQEQEFPEIGVNYYPQILEQLVDGPKRDVDSNSWAIVHMDERVTALEVLTAANSSALTKQRDAIYKGPIYRCGDASSAVSVAHGASIRSVDWGPDGRYIVIGGDGTSYISVRVYEFLNFTSLSELSGCQVDHGEDIRAVQWHPSGNYLAMAGDNGSGNHNIRVYSFNGTSLTELNGCHVNAYGAVYGLEWSHDGEYLAVVGDNVLATGGDVVIYEFDDTLETLSERHGDSVRLKSFSGCRALFPELYVEVTKLSYV